MDSSCIECSSRDAYEQTHTQPELWGRLLESAVGAHLCNQALGTQIQVYYWREANKEVDYILTKGNEIVAIEVKSDSPKNYLAGMNAFTKLYAPKRSIQVSNQDLALEKFFRTPIEDLFA